MIEQQQEQTKEDPFLAKQRKAAAPAAAGSDSSASIVPLFVVGIGWVKWTRIRRSSTHRRESITSVRNGDSDSVTRL